MNKIEFAKRIAARLSISQREALTFIGTYENILADALIDEGMSGQRYITDILDLQVYSRYISFQGQLDNLVKILRFK